VKLSTGLLPAVEHRAIPNRPALLSTYLSGGDLNLPIPHAGGTEVWIVRLKTPEASVAHPEGTVLALHVLTSEPDVKRHQTKLELFDEFPDSNANHERLTRERLAIPDDAMVHDVPCHGGIRRILRWHTVTA